MIKKISAGLLTGAVLLGTLAFTATEASAQPYGWHHGWHRDGGWRHGYGFRHPHPGPWGWHHRGPYGWHHRGPFGWHHHRGW